MRPRISIQLFFGVLATCILMSSPVWAVKSVGDLKKIEGQVQNLVAKVMPCTVCVRSANGQGSGSGVIVSEDGLVLTAAHVTMAAGEELVIVFPDGRKAKAKSLGANRGRDAGMVQITEEEKFPFVEVGKSSEIKRDDWCISLGHAGGFQADRTPPVRLGRVLGNGRFVVTDCTIIGGDSGGPLFDLEGRLIGIHSNIGESLSQNQHVPIDVFTEDWDRMKDGEIWGRLGGGGDPRRPVMGVELSPAQNDDGVVLGGITPNSPASRAGLKKDDVITRINGKQVSSATDVVRLVMRKRAGDEIKLKVKRDEELLDFNLKLVRASQLGRSRPQRPRQRPPVEDEPADEEKKESEESKEKPADDSKATEANKDEPKSDAKEPDDGADKKDDADSKDTKGRSVEELLREARRNRGRLELTPEERTRMEKFMRERIGGGFGMQVPVNQGPDKWFEQVSKAYEPVVAIAKDSTYRVYVDGEQVALGTAVSPNKLLTKASEIEDRDFEIEIKKRKRVEGEIVEVFSEYDLALIEIKEDVLKPIDLSAEAKEMPLGTFLASVGKAKTPAAIGLISVKTREFASAKGFLGVYLNKVPAGIVVLGVSEESPAEAAGLKVGDVILKLNGKGYDKLQELIGAVGSHRPDETIKLQIRRGEEEMKVDAKLGIRMADPRSRLERMNRMGSELSETRTGFPKALQHDCPIDPTECGGPLVNLDGDVVGINIARAGRIKSYALPNGVVKELLESVKAKAEATP